METKKFKKLLKNTLPREIIRKYCNNDIYLTQKQLQIVIDLKNKGENNVRK